MLRDANTHTVDAEHSLHHVVQELNEFRHIPCIVSDLSKPDLLKTMLIGILDYLQLWMFHFMKTQVLLDQYNAIWLFIPANQDLTPQNESYKEEPQ